VYGQRWAQTEAPEVLAVYAGYIMLLALNGAPRSGFDLTKSALSGANLATKGWLQTGNEQHHRQCPVATRKKLVAFGTSARQGCGCACG
jgi:hypothetical protein